MDDIGQDDGLKMGQIVARCWSDEAFKAKFLKDPKAILAEYDVAVPEGIDIEVVENTKDKRFFLLPDSPQNGEMSHEDLSQVNGACCWCH